MFFAFNELSMHNANLENETDARNMIDELVLFCQNLNAEKIIDEIIWPDSFYLSNFSQDYGISQWLGDREVSRTYRQFFRRFLDKYRRTFNSSSIEGEFAVCIDNQERSSIGCTFALEHDHTAFSVPTREIWRNTDVLGQYTTSDPDGNLQQLDRAVKNVWPGLVMEYIISENRRELNEGISSGQDLWDKKERLFPNLVLCENVKHQLFEDSEKYHVHAVMKKLNRFQEYFSVCDGPYDPKDLGMNARTESDTVKSDPYLRSLRCFTMPNGEEKHFFDHVGFVGKYTDGRIHFLPDTPNKRCYIGYIGRHLPTKKF